MHSKEFEKPLPFSVELSSTNLEASQGKDVEFRIRVTGERIPKAFYIKGNTGIRMMNRLNTNDFRFVFKNVYQNEEFYVEGGDYRSQMISIIVRPNPTMLYYEAKLTFPKYIHRKNENLSGKTRIIVPQGTDVEFTFHTRDVNSLKINDSIPLEKSNDDYIFTSKYTKTTKFNVTLYNNWNTTDAIPFTVKVIPDAYPDIHVQNFHEDFAKQTYYSLHITDSILSMPITCTP